MIFLFERNFERKVIRQIFSIQLFLSIILLSLFFCNDSYAEQLTYEHYLDIKVAENTSYTETFTVSTEPTNAVLTNVEAQFTYIAYNGYENYLSARINKGSPPGSSGGDTLVAQGSLPSSHGSLIV